MTAKILAAPLELLAGRGITGEQLERVRRKSLKVGSPDDPPLFFVDGPVVQFSGGDYFLF